MNKYYKLYAESVDGNIGECYIEVDSDRLITKQVLVFGTSLYWATPEEFSDEMYLFTEQPEIDEEIDELESIEAEEFFAIWKKSGAV